MKWLFLLVVFDLSADDLLPRMAIRQVFDTEAACHELGRGIERDFVYEDNSLKSFSMCLPEDAFKERKIKVQRYDPRNRD